MTYTDDILYTYLAGSLDADTAYSLEADIADDRELEARLMALDPFAAPIKEAFANIPTPERVTALAQTVQFAQPSSMPWLRYAAAAMVGVTIGYSTFAIQPGNGPLLSDWRDQVAAYQVLYVTETVQGISATPEEISAQFSMANTQIGLDLQQAALGKIPTLDLKRAQVLGFKDQPLIQIAFEGSNGTPVALCIIRNDAGAGALEAETLAGLASASWSTDTHSFLLIGGTEQAQITQTASMLIDVF